MAVDLDFINEVAIVNEAKTYKALAGNNSNINNSFAYTTVEYQNASSGSYDTDVFQPVANGVQLLKDLENVIVNGSVFVTSTGGARQSLGMSVTINGVQSDIEGTGYIRRASGHDECLFIAEEFFTSLNAGDVITISSKRNGGASSGTNGVPNKGALSIHGFVASTAQILSGFPTPVVTSINIV